MTYNYTLTYGRNLSSGQSSFKKQGEVFIAPYSEHTVTYTNQLSPITP